VTDEQALLAAIAHEPGSDTPRRVFADWLQDNGLRYRADLIHHQCDTGRVYFGECLEWSPNSWRWVDGTPDLHGGYEFDDAQSWMPPPAVGAKATIDRGFIRALECSAAYWLAHADAVALSHPTLRRVRLTTMAEMRWLVVAGRLMCFIDLADADGKPRTYGYDPPGDMRPFESGVEAVRIAFGKRWPGVAFDLPAEPFIRPDPRMDALRRDVERLRREVESLVPGDDESRVLFGNPDVPRPQGVVHVEEDVDE
jgi:uncharacterized protein (TIGR02996 family)